MSAKLIMFDGPDGVGKTTQIKLIAQALSAKGLSVLTTRINGGSPIGEALRTVYIGDYPRPAATDFFLGQAIYAAFTTEVEQQRPNYDVILVDRSPLSNVAYQSFGSGYPLDEALQACEGTLKDLRPDLIICYTAPLATLRARVAEARGANPDYFESKSDDFFEKVIEGYNYVTDYFKIKAVDASVDSNEVERQTMVLVEQALAG
jgi:dTMP kinase